MDPIAVIGAGLSGTLVAIELAKKYKVVLIESGKEVIPTNSSSYNECYKLHTGAHYIGDKKTAEHCLKKAIEFARQFPEQIAGSGDLLSPWRRGRHYLMSNSIVTKEQATDIALHLQEIYKDLVTKDPKNKVFGEPQNFVKFLEPEDYSLIAKAIPFYDKNNQKTLASVALGIETAESQIDIYKLRRHLGEKIKNHPNITFLSSSRVKDIGFRQNDLGYTISYTKDDDTHELNSSAVVNCAWQNIEILDNKIGAYVPDINRVNRIKVSILVELPDALKKMNTCIFSLGPYCSFTILPQGKAILTSERITNIGFFKAGEDILPEKINQLLNTELSLTHPKGRRVAKQILEDCASYLRKKEGDLLKQAKVEELHTGFVKLINIKKKYNKNSIYEKGSVIHSRQEDGIEQKSLGYISNSGMKMTYTAGNALKVAKMLNENFKVMHQLKELAKLIKKKLSPELIKMYEKIIDPLLNITLKKSMVEELLQAQSLEECAQTFVRKLENRLKNHANMINFFTEKNKQNNVTAINKSQDKDFTKRPNTN